MITEVKNTVPWTHLIEEFHGEIEHFMKKNCKRKIKLRVKKVIREKVINYISNGEVMIIH